MEPLKGCLLVPTAKNADTGLWFIFHHESEGVLAFDVTTEHPDIPLRHFHTLLKTCRKGRLNRPARRADATGQRHADPS